MRAGIIAPIQGLLGPIKGLLGPIKGLLGPIRGLLGPIKGPLQALAPYKGLTCCCTMCPAHRLPRCVLDPWCPHPAPGLACMIWHHRTGLALASCACMGTSLASSACVIY